MPKRRKKKPVRLIHPSEGPLSARLAPLHAGRVLVFSDASQKRHGGLAAVLFETPESEALVKVRTVGITGSNELELQATLFALEQAKALFPGRPLSLFSDNQDAATRLNRAKTLGLAQDPELRQFIADIDLGNTLTEATICWIKGHSICRGNILADLHAANAAN
ncbi:MAG: hypothetical protein H6R14_2425 [Proteobacteria bacterium]|nr:hypothetical protein [Pseudomonadota bacterium]